MSLGSVLANWKKRIQAIKIGWARSSSPESELKSIERGTSEDQKQQEIVAALQAINRETTARAECERAKKNDVRPWEIRRFWLDVVAIIIAGGAGYIFWLQEVQMEGQLRVLEDEHRPFVYFDHFDYAVEKYGPGAVDFDIYVRPVFANSGGSATKRLIITTNCATYNPGPAIEPFEHFGGVNMKAVPQVLGPRTQAFGEGCRINGTQIPALKAGGYHFYFLGQAEYHAKFADHRFVTQICYELLDPELVGNTFRARNIPRGRHNCADDDCQD